MKKQKVKIKKLINIKTIINIIKSGSNMAKVIIFGVLEVLGKLDITKYIINRGQVNKTDLKTIQSSLGNIQVRHNYVWTRTCTLFFFDLCKKREDNSSLIIFFVPILAIYTIHKPQLKVHR